MLVNNWMFNFWTENRFATKFRVMGGWPSGVYCQPKSKNFSFRLDFLLFTLEFWGGGWWLVVALWFYCQS